MIRISAAGTERMRGLLSAAVATAVAESGPPGTDGWVTARVPIESARHALADFLRLGADLEILEPADLRAQAADTARALTALYA